MKDASRPAIKLMRFTEFISTLLGPERT